MSKRQRSNMVSSLRILILRSQVLPSECLTNQNGPRDHRYYHQNVSHIKMDHDSYEFNTYRHLHLAIAILSYSSLSPLTTIYD